MAGALVLIADRQLENATHAVAGNFPELDLRVPADDDTLLEVVRAADALVTQNAPVGRPILERAGGLRLLIKLGRVYDHIDSDAVRERGIAFGLVPRKGPNCVAEHALTLILALSKNLVMAHRSVAEGAFRWRGLRPILTSQHVMAFRWMEPVRLHEVLQKTLGCVGFGEIGCELSLRVRPLGMRVLYTRRRPLPPALERHYAVRYRPLPDLLEESDYVCLALPHTEETHHLIGTDELRRLGPNSYLVNVARGGIVDENALVRALREGIIAGAALDVFTHEPLPSNSPLCTLDNVIMTPHIGGGTGTNSQFELGEALAEVRNALSGGALHCPVALIGGPPGRGTMAGNVAPDPTGLT
jgi:phosphoglycerate dehydrogenase-like enzyme